MPHQTKAVLVATLFLFINQRSIQAQSGAALNFDGTSDFIALPSTTVLTGLPLAPFTMEAWVNPSSTVSLNSIIRKDVDYCFYISAGSLRTEMSGSGGAGGTFTTTAATTATFLANTWSHVAAVWNGTICTLYINGNTIVTNTSTSSNGSISNLTIGKSVTFTQPFVGSIDEIRIWKRALCQGEIQNNMNAELSLPQTALILYYNLMKVSPREITWQLQLQPMRL